MQLIYNFRILLDLFITIIISTPVNHCNNFSKPFWNECFLQLNVLGTLFFFQLIQLKSLVQNEQ